MRIVHTTCAGIDVHKRDITVCLITQNAAGQRVQEVRTFGMVTKDLLGMRDWLQDHGCEVVAIESTGVYWKPVFNLLEDDFEVLLVNPAYLKHVPGRKTDVKDSEWIAELLGHGLLRGSFIPPREIRDLRDVTRYRRRLVQMRTSEVNRLQKVLEDANVKVWSAT
jgi:transposase